MRVRTAVPDHHPERTSTSASAEKGVSGGGLMTAVQPAARAAPSFRVIIADGKFHGVRIDLYYCINAAEMRAADVETHTTPSKTSQQTVPQSKYVWTDRWAA